MNKIMRYDNIIIVIRVNNRNIKLTVLFTLLINKVSKIYGTKKIKAVEIIINSTYIFLTDKNGL